MRTTADSLAGLVARFRSGDKAALDELFQALYPELRRLAASKMKGERTEHTWQPTLLVNELYLTMTKVKDLHDRGISDDKQKAAFLGLAGHFMRRLLIEHSRPLYRKAQKVQYEEAREELISGGESLQLVEESLSRLAAIDPKFRTVVEMKVFEGLTGDEIAEQLKCSPTTVARYWNFAKRWLEKELPEPQQS